MDERETNQHIHTAGMANMTHTFHKMAVRSLRACYKPQVSCYWTGNLVLVYLSPLCSSGCLAHAPKANDKQTTVQQTQQGADQGPEGGIACHRVFSRTFDLEYCHYRSMKTKSGPLYTNNQIQKPTEGATQIRY